MPRKITSRGKINLLRARAENGVTTCHTYGWLAYVTTAMCAGRRRRNMTRINYALQRCQQPATESLIQRIIAQIQSATNHLPANGNKFHVQHSTLCDVDFWQIHYAYMWQQAVLSNGT